MQSCQPTRQRGFGVRTRGRPTGWWETLKIFFFEDRWRDGITRRDASRRISRVTLYSHDVATMHIHFYEFGLFYFEGVRMHGEAVTATRMSFKGKGGILVVVGRDAESIWKRCDKREDRTRSVESHKWGGQGLDWNEMFFSALIDGALAEVVHFEVRPSQWQSCSLFVKRKIFSPKKPYFSSPVKQT